MNQQNEKLPQVDRYRYQLGHYFRYFKHRLIYLILASSAAFILFYSYLQNKNYSAQVVMKIEEEQPANTNIIASSISHLSGQSSILNNIYERILVKAKSREFYYELAEIVMTEERFSFIYFKLAKEQKPWLHFIKSIYQTEQPDKRDFKKVKNIISRHLYHTVSVSKEQGNILNLRVTTKNKKLTRNIQALLESYAEPLLLADLLEKTRSELDILIRSEKEIFKEFEQLDKDYVRFQHEFDTLSPNELPKRYSETRIELEKKFVESKIKLEELETLMFNVEMELKKGRGQNYQLRQERQEIDHEMTKTISRISAIQNKIKNINKRFKDLPRYGIGFGKLERQREILSEKLYGVIREKTMARITHEKALNSLSVLELNDSLETASGVVILFKAIVASLISGSLFVALLYYRQSLFPVVFRKEEIESFDLPVVGNCPEKNLLRNLMDGNEKKFEKLYSFNKIYNSTLKGSKVVTLSNIAESKNTLEDTIDCINFLIDRGVSVYFYNFSSEKIASKIQEKIEKSNSELFYFQDYLPDHNPSALIDMQEVNTKLPSLKKTASLVFLYAPHASRSPNPYMLAKVSDCMLVMVELFKTGISDLEEIQKNKKEMNIDKTYVLMTNSIPKDNIINYIDTDVRQNEQMLQAS